MVGSRGEIPKARSGETGLGEKGTAAGAELKGGTVTRYLGNVSLVEMT